MNISCNIVPYAVVECLCAGKPQHDPGERAVPLANRARVQTPPPHHALSFPTDVSLPRGSTGKVLWAVVLTCLKLYPGTLESTLISGQCTLVCCYSSALPQSEGHSLESGGFSDV